MKQLLVLCGLLLGAVAFAGENDLPGLSPIAGGTPDPTLPQLTDLGPGDPAQTLSIYMAFRSKDPAGLAAYAKGVSDPSSPDFRQFLTTAQFCDKFGADANAIALAKAYFNAKGIALTGESSCTDLFGRATVAQIEDTFSTKMEKFSVPATAKAPAFTALTFSTPLLLPSSFAAAIAAAPNLTIAVATPAVPPTPASPIPVPPSAQASR